MLVWGGYGDVGYDRVGGRYDPMTDTWTSMSVGPKGRQLHTAVWTGSELIVWGGYGSSGLERSGSRYDPA